MRADDLPLPIIGERFRLENRGDEMTIVRLADGAEVGRIRIEGTEGAVLVRSLCIDEPHRSYGAGSEAARLFNQACQAAKVPLVRTWAPRDLGLSAYSWFRMGYSTVPGEGPDGGIWFERRLE